jgi:hypothetical protein
MENLTEETIERLKTSFIKTLERNFKAFEEETKKYGRRLEKITTLDYKR